MLAYIFPGQGSQCVGMGKDLFKKFPHIVEAADKILGYSIEELCLQDPNGVLSQTQYTQPALYTVNCLYYLEKQQSGALPDYVAGHSLGEYNALFAAGAFDFETGLRLVKKRGELMAMAPEGAMAAIVRVSKEAILEALENAGLNDIVIANQNSPQQFIISGKKADIDAAEEYFSQQGIMFIRLKTSGAFHSPYMKEVEMPFSEYLRSFSFSHLKLPVVSNVHARTYMANELYTNLTSQISSPVRWTESIGFILNQGDVTFEEVGPGSVLTKLIADISKAYSESPELVLPKQTDTVENVNTVSSQTQHETTIKQANFNISNWNNHNSIGTEVKIKDYQGLYETRTEAIMLFGYKPAIYIEGFNGYFDLEDVSLA